MTWTTGHVTTYEGLLMTRALMGISEAFYIPAALALIADFHAGPTRSRAVGLHQMGIYLGVIIGGFGGYAADHPALGWRWAFEACGLIGVLYAVPLFLALRTAAPVMPRAAARDRLSPGGALRELLGNRSFILLVLYFTLPALAGWVVRDWMPAILKAEFGIGQGLAGVSATLYWQSAAIVGAVAGGWLADRWMRRTPRGRIFASALGMVLIVPAMFGVGYAPQTGLLWVAIAFLILFGLGWGFFDSQQHADPVSGGAARTARDRLRDHELRQHQLRRLCRLGLRDPARPPRPAVRHLRRLRQRGDRLDDVGVVDSPPGYGGGDVMAQGSGPDWAEGLHRVASVGP